MIIRHMPLVAFVVGRMSGDGQRTLGMEREDALGYGLEGLIQAVDSFDPTRGTSFASFAVRRIRGSILDAIRKMDPLPRSVRRSAREVDRASQDLAAQLGRWPTPKELAFRMGVDVEQVRHVQRQLSSRFVSLEHTLQNRTGDSATAWDPADEDELSDPGMVAEYEASMDLLRSCLTRLTPREQAILRLRYVENKPFHEIGSMLGLSESRVCQLHKRILGQLKRQMNTEAEAAAA